MARTTAPPARQPVEASDAADTQPLVGIEIGGTKLQIVLAGRPSMIAARWRGSANRTGGGPGIQQQIATGLRELLGRRTPRAVGVGFGGPIDVATGCIRRSHQIDGWEGFPLRDWLAELTEAPVAVENDANAAALGEAIYGAGRGLDPLFYCNFGSGVGGGLVAGGNVYHGRSAGEMEFGHLRFDPAAGDRIVEHECSGWAIDRSLRAAAEKSPKSRLAVVLKGMSGGEATRLGPLLSAGDKDASRVFDRLCTTIAFNLSHVVHLLNPAAIVVGGGLAQIGEPLRSGVAARLPGYVMQALHPIPEVRLAELAEDAVPVGALELAARIATIPIA